MPENRISDELVDEAAKQFWDRWQPDWFPAWDEATEARDVEASELRRITRDILEAVWPEPLFTNDELSELWGACSHACQTTENRAAESTWAALAHKLEALLEEAHGA